LTAVVFDNCSDHLFSSTTVALARCSSVIAQSGQLSNLRRRQGERSLPQTASRTSSRPLHSLLWESRSARTVRSFSMQQRRNDRVEALRWREVGREASSGLVGNVSCFPAKNNPGMLPLPLSDTSFAELTAGLREGGRRHWKSFNGAQLKQAGGLTHQAIIAWPFCYDPDRRTIDGVAGEGPPLGHLLRPKDGNKGAHSSIMWFAYSSQFPNFQMKRLRRGPRQG
jgi:hypothetical protein